MAKLSSSTRRPERSRAKKCGKSRSICRPSVTFFDWTNISARWLIVGLAWLAVCGAGAIAVEGAKLTEHERAALAQKLHSKQVKVRLEAISKLAEFPEPEAVRILIKQGLSDADDGVRRAAYDAMLVLCDQPTICDFLVEQLNQDARKGKISPNSPLLLAVLLTSDLGDVQKATLRYVNEHLAAARDGRLFLVRMAELLALRRDRSDIVPLVRLAKTKVWEQFAVRRAIVGALTQIDDVEAVDALVGLMPGLDGEVRADAVEYMVLLTKQKLTEPAEWTTWWKANKATFQFPKPFERPATRVVDNLVYGADVSTYYRLPLYGKRLVFVIDASGSMAGERIVAAKRELANAVRELKDHVQFSIIVFNDDVFFWRRQLIDATTASKNDALRFIDQIGAVNQTATYDALQAAFYFDAEAIYLLTDGAPSTGRIVALIDIVNAVTAQNRLRRESIYTVGIEPGEDGPFAEFLRALAERNFGLYRQVDE
jgi:von Willebrand factor type A domain-containing protein/HEAT repeat protein